MINNVWTILVTCVILLTPSLVEGNNVKFSLKNSCESIDHEHSLIYTTVHQYIFEENSNDGVHKVVIDAGHGGHDPGTHGAHSEEKDIALQIALNFGKRLNLNYSDIEVIYTRDKDVFVPLHERIAIANRNKADLFISIHCNYAANKNVCGSETFVMGLHRAADNLNIAKRENSVVLMESDYEKNYDGYDPNSPVGHILLSMFQNAFMDKSISFASDIENSLNSRKDYPSRGVKQAGFVVLREATMPSVLVETGFLSNPQEEKYLMSPTGQNEIAEKLTLAAAKYMNVIRKEEKNNYVDSYVPKSPTTKIQESSTEGKVMEPLSIVKVDATKDKKEEIATKNPSSIVIASPSKSPKIEVSAPPKVKTSVSETKKLTYTEHTSTNYQATPPPSKRKTTTSEPLYYTIQVGAFSKAKGDFFKKYEDDIGEVIELKVDNLYKYMVGKFYNKEEAIAACREIKNRGISDAYVLKLSF